MNLCHVICQIISSGNYLYRIIIFFFFFVYTSSSVGHAQFSAAIIFSSTGAHMHKTAACNEPNKLTIKRLANYLSDRYSSVVGRPRILCMHGFFEVGRQNAASVNLAPHNTAAPFVQKATKSGLQAKKKKRTHHFLCCTDSSIVANILRYTLC